jgi:anti-sigma regulatory factor (Ser/Thr protein kinase)
MPSRTRDPGSITVLARYEPGRLLVTVADDGIGMVPDPDSPGLGCGIPIIMQVCEDVRFHSSAAGTIGSMSFSARIGTSSGEAGSWRASAPATRDEEQRFGLPT